MLCTNCLASIKMQIQAPNSELEGIIKIWCPTWFGAEKGPMPTCVEHALTFTEFNQANPRNDGQFFFNEEAEERFNQVRIFKADDERYQNIKGMLANGTLYKGEKPEMDTRLHRDSIVIVDGKAWYICQWHAIDLGEFSQAKRDFPKLMNI